MAWAHADPVVRNFADLIRSRMAAPDKAFIRSDDGRDFAFAGLWALAGQLARALRLWGVAPGDRVAVQAEKCPEFLALYLACLRSGAVFMPLNTAYTLTELAYFFSDAEPRLLIVDPARADAVSALDRRSGEVRIESLGSGGTGSLLTAARTQDESLEDHESHWEDPAAILYTSGTTGRSKGAVLSHGNLASNALALIDVWEIAARDVLIHALPVHHLHGLFTATNTLLLAGGTMLFRSKFDAGDVLRLIPEATCLMGVPTFYTRLLQSPDLTRKLTAHMRVFISGSAPLLAETHRAFEARTGHAIVERYGMTETGILTSSTIAGRRGPGSVGMALPGVGVRIADAATGAPLPLGEIGMIEVGGPNVFRGYWRRPERPATDFRADGFFITGDLGSLDAEGNVTISGRGKDLVITGGFNVYPKEIEAEIDALDCVVESAVIGLPHPDLGEGVTAVVVAEPGGGVDEVEVLAGLNGRLARFKMPKRVILVDELPRNAMGKVQKSVLRATYAGLYSGDEDISRD